MKCSRGEFADGSHSVVTGNQKREEEEKRKEKDERDYGP